MKVVVIGGVAGGPSFATRLRRLNEEHEIVIYERGEKYFLRQLCVAVLFRRCD